MNNKYFSFGDQTIFQVVNLKNEPTGKYESYLINDYLTNDLQCFNRSKALQRTKVEFEAEQLHIVKSFNIIERT